MFYKAVRVTDTGYKSVFIGSRIMKDSKYLRAPKYELTYIPNEWTLPHPETNGIYVFDRLFLAEDFIHGLRVYDDIEIWACKAENPVSFPRIAEIHNESILDFWNVFRRTNGSSYSYESKESPYGSRLVTKCMITERVEYN